MIDRIVDVLVTFTTTGCIALFTWIWRMNTAHANTRSRVATLEKMLSEVSQMQQNGYRSKHQLENHAERLERVDKQLEDITHTCGSRGERLSCVEALLENVRDMIDHGLKTIRAGQPGA